MVSIGGWGGWGVGLCEGELTARRGCTWCSFWPQNSTTAHVNNSPHCLDGVVVVLEGAEVYEGVPCVGQVILESVVVSAVIEGHLEPLLCKALCALPVQSAQLSLTTGIQQLRKGTQTQNPLQRYNNTDITQHTRTHRERRGTAKEVEGVREGTRERRCECRGSRPVSLCE